MTEYKLRYVPKLSKKQSINKILAHATFGDHKNSFRPKDGRDLNIYFIERGVKPSDLIEKCRDPRQHVPVFENLIGSTWTGPGGMSIINADGEVITELKEPGMLIRSTYQAHFEAAAAARDRSVEEASVIAFFECITQGFSSIEAFLHEEARRWNKQNPEDKLVDSKEQKVSLETKLLEWVPKITNGKRVKRNNRSWSDFKLLKRIRDEDAIHPKNPGQSISYRNLAKYLNSFRYGVALFLGNLHLLFDRTVPAVIINSVYQPEIEVYEESPHLK